MGYVGIWVSNADEEADRDLDLEPDGLDVPPIVEALATKYHTGNHQLRGRRGKLYRLGITLLVITVMMLLINFVLSILACREVRRKDAVREEGEGQIDPRDPARRRYRIPAAHAHAAGANGHGHGAAGRHGGRRKQGVARSRTVESQFPGYEVVTVNEHDGGHGRPVVSRPPPTAMAMAMTGAVGPHAHAHHAHRGVDLGVEISPGHSNHNGWHDHDHIHHNRSGSPTDIDLTPVSPGSSDMTEVLTEKDSGIGIGRSGR